MLIVQHALEVDIQKTKVGEQRCLTSTVGGGCSSALAPPRTRSRKLSVPRAERHSTLLANCWGSILNPQGRDSKSGVCSCWRSSLRRRASAAAEKWRKGDVRMMRR